MWEIGKVRSYLAFDLKNSVYENNEARGDKAYEW
jgi:hypothetical protein